MTSITRMQDTSHDWDRATACCKRCGRRWLDLLVIPAEDRACTTATNVVGVSHRIARGKIIARWRDAGLLP